MSDGGGAGCVFVCEGGTFSQSADIFVPSARYGVCFLAAVPARVSLLGLQPSH